MECKALTARAMKTEDHFLRAAIALAHANVAAGGRPFGAVVVRGGEIVATGVNDVIGSHDPTAHAELAAIRAASQALGSADLSACAVFASALAPTTSPPERAAMARVTTSCAASERILANRESSGHRASPSLTSSWTLSPGGST